MDPEEAGSFPRSRSGEGGEGDRRRGKGPDPVHEDSGLLIPVQGRVRLLHAGRQSGLGVVLGTRTYAAGGQAGQGLHQEFRAQGGEPGEQFAAGFAVPDGGCPLQQDGSRVESGVHEHGRDPGPAEAPRHRPDCGRGASQFGEQGGVDVDRAESGDGEEAGGEDLAVVGDHQAVGGEFRERLPGAPSPDAFGLLDRYPQFRRQRLDAADPGTVAPAGGPIRLGDRRDHPVLPVQRAEHGFGKGRGPEEDDAEALHLRPSVPVAPGCPELPVAASHAAAQFADDEVPLQHSEPIQEQAAVQVVHLVGESPRQEALALQLEGRTVETLAADPHPRRPPGDSGIPRNRQAPLFLRLASP